jgi:hypothetical protein
MTEGKFKLTFVGWAIFLFLLYLASKTKFGHNLIYYSLVLILIFLLITSTKKIIDVSTEGE